MHPERNEVHLYLEKVKSDNFFMLMEYVQSALSPGCKRRVIIKKR